MKPHIIEDMKQSIKKNKKFFIAAIIIFVLSFFLTLFLGPIGICGIVISLFVIYNPVFALFDIFMTGCKDWLVYSLTKMEIKKDMQKNNAFKNSTTTPVTKSTGNTSQAGKTATVKRSTALPLTETERKIARVIELQEREKELIRQKELNAKRKRQSD